MRRHFPPLLVLVVFSIFLCITILRLPPPPPVIHDEHVNLLIADTLLHGRLANPPHRFASHFETIYVLQRPSYAGIYPIGTGALLAAGKLLTGRFYDAIAIGAVCTLLCLFWAFTPFLPPVWSAVGAGFFTFTLVTSTGSPSWISYFNSFVGVCGGAIAFGAFRRWLDRPSARVAAVFAAGCMMGFFTRPFESGVLGVVLVCTGVAYLVLSKRPFPPLGPSLLAFGAIAGMGLGLTALHNQATTGNWALIPYMYSMRVHGVPQTPVWGQEVPEPPGLAPSQHLIYVWQRDLRREYQAGLQSFGDRLTQVVYSVGRAKAIYLLIAAGVFALPDFWMAALILGSLTGLVAGLIYPHFVLHYYGPFFPMLLLLPLRSAHALTLLAKRLPGGVRVAALTCAVGAVVISSIDRYLPGNPARDYGRNTVQAALAKNGGQHLVFVKYRPDHDYFRKEWIYNEADIDASAVVWARTLGTEQDAELRRYFAGRKVWLATPGEAQLLRPWPAASPDLPVTQLDAPNLRGN